MESGDTKNSQDDFTKFTENILIQLIQENEQLEKLIAKDQPIMESVELKQKKLLEIALNSNPLPNVSLIHHITQTNKKCVNTFNMRTVLNKDKFQELKQYYNAMSTNYTQHLKSSFKYDNFTMMPFHDVEAAIKEVQTQKMLYFEEMKTFKQRSINKFKEFELQMRNIQSDNETLKIYEQEMKIALDDMTIPSFDQCYMLIDGAQEIHKFPNFT